MNWTSADGQDWEDPANWDSNAVPGTSSVPRIDLTNFLGVNNQPIISAGENESVAGFFVGFSNSSDSTTSLGIQGGGTITSAGGTIIGFFPGSVGSLIITGEGSTLTNLTPGTTLGSIFEIGSAGSGTLSVSAGGGITGAAAEIGSFGGFGQAVVTDPGSTWTASTLVVGNIGTGILSVANGGYVSCEQLTISESVTSSVGVDGGGSVLNILNDSGSGVLTVGTGNGSNGILVVSNGGTLNVSGSLQLGVNASTAMVSLTNANFTMNAPQTTLQIGGTNGIQADPTGNYTFNFGDATIQVVHSDLTTSINMTLAATNTTSTINTNGFNATLTGNLSGNGSLTKSGAGNLTLGGNNTYTGSTTVSVGTLTVNGNLSANGTVAVNSGAVLGGNGSVGTVVLNIGGIYTAVNQFGILSWGNFTWGGANTETPTMLFNLSTTSDESAQLSVNGTFTKGSGTIFEFDFQSTGWNNGAISTMYELVDFNFTSGFSVGDFSYINLAPGLYGTFSLTASNLFFTTVPEPATWGLVAGGLVWLAVSRRKRLQDLAH